MVVYRDDHHITGTFSASLSPVLDATMRPIVMARLGRDRINARTSAAHDVSLPVGPLLPTR